MNIFYDMHKLTKKSLRVKGVTGLLEPIGESGREPGSTDKFLKPGLFVPFKMVILLVITT